MNDKTTKMTPRQYIADNWEWALEKAAASLIADEIAAGPPRSLKPDNVPTPLAQRAVTILGDEYKELRRK